MLKFYLKTNALMELISSLKATRNTCENIHTRTHSFENIVSRHVKLKKNDDKFLFTHVS